MNESGLLANAMHLSDPRLLKRLRTKSSISFYIKMMAPRWHQGTMAPRALKKNNKNMFWKNAQKQILVLRAFSGPRGHGSMQEPLGMVTASLMQNMVQVRKEISIP